MASTFRVLKTFYRTPIFQESRWNPFQQSSSKRFLSDSLKNKFTKFQIEDGIPVYLKGGFADKILFGISSTLCAFGIADGIYFLLSMAFPKKA
ncbi:cytochrome c oxidase subunit 7A1, mitochondrial [Anoplophora glabripennis]|uniref:cytochrome c oxidase subunit 7A1, mitochondrial n=1 Tax=Anoplophora glabripennis TaxID=217634 RepID=UPI000873D88C|nr:cytochrome c oxidase subunit 7A1, mitochondrial [Anoplophora glabripennis]